jgi:3,4-dihydroxy 2-butanone 4-phosphate synthase / GTP cyclohydrolase II
MNHQINTIEEAIIDLQRGKFVIVIDDEDRENEGDLICAASNITQQMVNFAITHAKGLLCTSISESIAVKLGLPPMTIDNTDVKQTNFTVSIDYLCKGCTTGISAYDRATTINSLADPNTESQNYSRPGHIFPLVAKEGGVLTRNGHTEAAIDLTKLAGLGEVGVLIEIIKPNGEMARLKELLMLSKQWNIKIITIVDLIKYRQSNPKFPPQTKSIKQTINQTSSSPKFEKSPIIKLPTKFGEFKIVVYKDLDTAQEYSVLYKDEVKIKDGNPTMARLHSACLTGDVFGSMRCDCGPQLEKALTKIQRAGNGIIIYLPHEGRGIGLFNKMLAYQLQDEGKDTVEANTHLGFPADLREYGFAGTILKDMGIESIELLTNNLTKVKLIEEAGILVAKRTGVVTDPNIHNQKYLDTKKERMGHVFDK